MNELSFLELIARLNGGLQTWDNFAWAFTRSVSTPEDYLLNTLLPDETMSTFEVRGGSMTITPTILNPTPMDTVGKPFGHISASAFLEQTAKIGGIMNFNESALRDLNEAINGLIQNGVRFGNVSNLYGDGSINPETGRADSTTVNGRRVNALLDFARLIAISHWDTREYLRSRALRGKIESGDFKANGVDLVVDYGLPSGNTYSAKTGNDAWKGSASKFWTEMRMLAKKFTSFTVFMTSDTFWSALDNASVNNIAVLAENNVNNYGKSYRIGRRNPSAVTQVVDNRDEGINIITYNRAGAVVKQSTTGGKAELQAKPFLKPGEWFATGDLNIPQIMLNAPGGILDPNSRRALGYTHIAPTVEGNNIGGVWSRIFTPDQRPFNMMAETYSNLLPVVLNPEKLVVGSTEM